MPQRLGSLARPFRARGTCPLPAERATIDPLCTPARPTSASWYSFRSAHDAFSPCALSDLPDGRSFSCPGTDRRAHDNSSTTHPSTTTSSTTQKTREHPMELTGAQALIKSLEMQQVEVMFGVPVGAILPVYDPIIDSSIRHILVRHEQGAGHMAEGYAMVTGKPGVAMVTSGPGATNIVTPLANAYMDSIPLVVVTGQVPTTAIGTDAFQECPITGVTRDITKHNWLVTDAQDLPRVVAEAFHVATTGRPGPVLIDVPKDVSNALMDWYWPAGIDELDLPGYKPQTEGDPALVKSAAELILAAER